MEKKICRDCFEKYQELLEPDRPETMFKVHAVKQCEICQGRDQLGELYFTSTSLIKVRFKPDAQLTDEEFKVIGI